MAGKPPGVTRRSFIQTVGISAAASSVAASTESLAERTAATDEPEILGPGPINITLKVNGKQLRTTIEPATTLLEALRFHLNLTGTKEICDRGSCGGCSVLLNGQLVNSCMTLAVDAVGVEIATVEGLANGDKLDPIQEAFIKHDALQCGYCTPGLLMASKDLLSRNPKPSLDEIKQGLSGNLCRCGTYTNIFNAVLEASGQEPIQEGR